ncbi:MAG: hypothetical protein C0391_09125 [Anaerolinea sp.]|nr:hypothetical protein [Anaerolinea sp.]
MTFGLQGDRVISNPQLIERYPFQTVRSMADYRICLYDHTAGDWREVRFLSCLGKAERLKSSSKK